MSAERCELCGLLLPKNPVVIHYGEEEFKFCCEGCARVYDVARDTGMLNQILHATGEKPKSTPVLQKTVRAPKETAFFDIQGMWCSGCAIAAERVLKNEPGVYDASVSFAIEQGRIEYDEQLVNLKDLFKKLSPLGYRVEVTSSKEEKKKERLQNRVGLQLVAAVAFGMENMVLYLVQLYPAYSIGMYNDPSIRKIEFAVWALTTPVVFYGGFTFLAGAWRSLRAKTVGMDTLVTIGVLASYFYSVYATITGTGQTYFDSAAMIVTFILIGRYLETVGGAQARKDLRTLLQLQPELAWIQTDAGWIQVNAATLKEGNIFLVKPGERIPADGQILDAEVTLDESMLTGESLSVAKKMDDLVYAGTILREGAFMGRVTNPPGKTRLSQISDLVKVTLNQKPRIQRLADRASTYFAFAVLFFALTTFIGWYIHYHTIALALMIAVTVLVVACPCALGLATPLAMAVTMGRAANKGILIRTPEALESSHSVKRMIFDKTGTLTRGRFSVVELMTSPHTKLTSTDLLQITASVEQYSEHPIAVAIGHANKLPLFSVSDFVSLRGAGAAAILETTPPQRVIVGSTRLVSVVNEPELNEKADQQAKEGCTIVWIAIDGVVSGFISLKDQPNPTAMAALQNLKKQGIETVLLSGDSVLATETIARQLGIGSYEGGCSPEEKALRIKTWQEDGQKVGMVGDGVNDAPALAQSDLSFTNAGGSDIAGQASDLVLTRSDLRLVPWFLSLSRKTRSIILQNLGWAFAYNLITIPLAMSGRITPVIAAISMAVSSLIVVINSLRLRQQ